MKNSFHSAHLPGETVCVGVTIELLKKEELAGKIVLHAEGDGVGDSVTKQKCIKIDLILEIN